MAVPTRADAGELPSLLESFFARRGWTPWGFQRAAWGAFARGASGLIHVPTGAGKTYATYFGPLAHMISTPSPPAEARLRLLYITPLRAVARDIESALALPVLDCGLGLRVESRTGDTGSSVRARQKQRLPDILVTTPESLTLMLTWPDPPLLFRNLAAVIVDEWHELLSSKRGTQTELALARLRSIAPGLRTWGLSATLSNLDEAARTLVGFGPSGPGPGGAPYPLPIPEIISADMPRPVEIETLLPE